MIFCEHSTGSTDTTLIVLITAQYFLLWMNHNLIIFLLMGIQLGSSFSYQKYGCNQHPCIYTFQTGSFLSMT